MIKPVGGGKVKVFSEKGKALSNSLSKKAAQRRLAQIEWFKKHG
jgi:hypothetical protein